LGPQNQIFVGLLFITYAPAGLLFDVGQSTVWRDIRHLKPHVKERAPIPEKMEDKMGKISRIDELLDLEAFVDAALDEMPRPKNKQKRKGTL